jgi:hypothetical protein
MKYKQATVTDASMTSYSLLLLLKSTNLLILSVHLFYTLFPKHSCRDDRNISWNTVVKRMLRKSAEHKKWNNGSV